MTEIKRTKKADLAKPDDLLQVGKELKGYIQKNNLSSKIGGKSYAHVDAWKFAGGCFGLTAIVKNPVAKHNGEMMRIAFAVQSFPAKNGGTYSKETIVYYGFTHDEEGYSMACEGKKITRELIKPYYAYECECDIIRISTGKVVGSGTGFCSNLEASKAVFDEYSINSMAQTRSIGKGYRNLLGYIMNEAGHESTPAEEVEEQHIKESIRTNQKKSTTKPQMTSDQVKGALKKISSGEVDSIEEIEKYFEITDEQRSAFKAMFDSRV